MRKQLLYLLICEYKVYVYANIIENLNYRNHLQPAAEL